MIDRVSESRQVTLFELLDRVIDHGVALRGDITLSVADVDLIYLGLNLTLVPIERLDRLMGLDLPDRRGNEDA